MSNEKFKCKISQKAHVDFAIDVTCTRGSRKVEKTFYGWLPFKLFWIERWIVKTEKILKRLDKLESRYE